MSITGTGVEVLVNNSAVRTLRPGETSPEGVKLIDLGSGAALIEVDGRRWLMPLGSSTASSLVLQADVHVEQSDRVLPFRSALRRASLLNAHRVADGLDPDLVDGELARIGVALDVRDVVQISRLHRPILINAAGSG